MVQTVLPPLSVDSLFTQIVDHSVKAGKSALKDVVKMTKREQEVVVLLGEGKSNKEIGQKNAYLSLYR